jgi:heme/copper-type cytochrome/quinol oxidase subunit 2
VLERLRSLISGPLSALLVALMFAGCLVLWIGVPLGWLWVGSQIQSSASLGTALAVTMVGIIVTIVVIAAILSWLNDKHAELREARDLPVSGGGALEPILVGSAGIAVLLFAIWFFGFSGSSPVPLNLGY